MARFEVDVKALDDNIATRLSAIGDVAGNPEYDAILEASGEKLAEYFRGSIQQRGLVDSTQLRESVRPTKAKIDKAGGKYVDVYPQGVRRREGRKKAVRNAEVGYAHEYGVTRVPPKKSIPASHWMSNTVDDVGEEIADIMQKSILEIIDKNLGGYI